jgi:DNA-binding NtrC family response regulator
VAVDVRVVSATNRNLRQAVMANQFREELYYRVNVIAIELPPLRERAGDIKLLTHFFLKRYGQDRVSGFDDEAVVALEAYRWPGNVRELQNIVERACALADGPTVRRRDLPDYVLHGETLRAEGAPGLSNDSEPASALGLPLQEARERWLKTLETSYLRDLLERHGGNVSAAAKAAGIDRKTFHRLVTKYQLR